jgi:hypothetical protein
MRRRPQDPAEAERTKHEIVKSASAVALGCEVPERLNALIAHTKVSAREWAQKSRDDLRDAQWTRECWLQALYISLPRDRAKADLNRALDPNSLKGLTGRELDIALELRECQIRAIYFGQPTLRAAYRGRQASAPAAAGASPADRLAAVQCKVLQQYACVGQSKGLGLTAAWLCRPPEAGDYDCELHAAAGDDLRRMGCYGADGMFRYFNAITNEILDPDGVWRPSNIEIRFSKSG